MNFIITCPTPYFNIQSLCFFGFLSKQVCAESTQSLSVRNLWFVCIRLFGHALKAMFSTSVELPISNHSNITTMYTMKAAFCANICLWTLVIMSVAS